MGFNALIPFRAPQVYIPGWLDVASKRVLVISQVIGERRGEFNVCHTGYVAVATGSMGENIRTLATPWPLPVSINLERNLSLVTLPSI